MKNVIALLIIFLCLVTGLSAMDMSLGGGFHFDMNTGSGLKYEFGNENKYSLGYDVMSFGGFLFFDLSYAIIDINFAFGSIGMVCKENGKRIDFVDNERQAGNMTQLGFSILGKYPMEMGSITFFPLLGINYNMVLTLKDKNGETQQEGDDNGELVDVNPSTWNQFGILAGIGLDFPFNDNLFLRGQVLFQMRLPTSDRSEMADKWNKYAKDIGETGLKATATAGFGPRIQIGIGYKF